MSSFRTTFQLSHFFYIALVLVEYIHPNAQKVRVQLEYSIELGAWVSVTIHSGVHAMAGAVMPHARTCQVIGNKYVGQDTVPCLDQGRRAVSNNILSLA